MQYDFKQMTEIKGIVYIFSSITFICILPLIFQIILNYERHDSHFKQKITFHYYIVIDEFSKYINKKEDVIKIYK